MRSTAVVLALAVIGACDSGPGVCNRDGGAACFELPSDVMYTYGPGGNSDPLLIGCGPISPTPATMPVVLSGHVTDYGSNLPVADATFALFHLGDFDGTAIATATTDASGAYSMTLPDGTTDLLSGAIAGGGAVPELRDQLRPDLSQAAATADFWTATPDVLDTTDKGYVDVDQDPALARVWVHVADCNRWSIAKAVVVLSRSSGERDFVGGVPVFYSGSGGLVPLPIRHSELSVTGNDGDAVAVNVPLDGALYVQAWGFTDDAAAARGDESGLVLVAEHAVSRRAGGITRVQLWANQ